MAVPAVAIARTAWVEAAPAVAIVGTAWAVAAPAVAIAGIRGTGIFHLQLKVRVTEAASAEGAAATETTVAVVAGTTETLSLIHI